MLITSEAILLHSTKYSDTSLIVKFFTEKRGVQSFIIKGALSKKSPFRAALFSPLSIVEITFDDRHTQSLKFLKDINRQNVNNSTFYDPAQSAVLLFYNELLYKLLFDAGEDPTLFRFLKEEIQKVAQPNLNLTDLPIHFLLRLSVLLGITPQNNYSESHCYFSIVESQFQSHYVDENTEIPREESMYLSQLLNHKEISVPRNTRNRLLHYLIEYYKMHHEQIHNITSAEILASILH